MKINHITVASPKIKRPLTPEELREILRRPVYKEAFRKRLVSFDNINVYYYLEEIYKNL